VLREEKTYSIAYKTLTEGTHSYEMTIDKEFFDSIEYSEISDGNVAVNIELTKRISHSELSYSLEGTVKIACDRCLDSIDFPILYEGSILIKTSEPQNDIEIKKEVLYVQPDDEEIDLAHHLYESIYLSLPFQKVHPDDEKGKSTCNKQMLKKLKEYSGKKDKKDETDPRWDKLKNI